ncbi:MAG: hypothetical protein HPKKFMNG_01922 [Planctomycetes bacterium]|nr:hypothetical protein [Planctomycetota bacterium]
MRLAALCVLAGLLASTAAAHPFDDRADMITHIAVTADRKLHVTVLYYFATVPASYVEARFKLDADRNDKITSEERDKRLAELAQERLDNMDMSVHGRRVRLVNDARRNECFDLNNPENDFSAPGGFSVVNVRLGYALNFTADLAMEPEQGGYRVLLTFMNKAERIDDPDTQIRAFDERVQPRVVIENLRHERSDGGLFQVRFSYGVASQPPPVEPPVMQQQPGASQSSREQLKAMEERPREDQNREGFFQGLFSALRSGEGDFIYWFTALAFVFGWGAWHALQPGHGKTLVASYLIGTHGRPSDALFLGVVVTLAHTSGVLLLLGGITLVRELYPEMFADPAKALSEWITVAVGATILFMGVGLLLKRAEAGHAHEHDVFGRHVHPEDDHGHGAPPDPKRMSRLEILRLGILGGVVPCPAAFVIALISIEQRLFAAGLLLVLVFSLGLALVLATIGLMLVATKSYMHARRNRPRNALYRFMETKVPVLGALAITLIGFTMVLMALLRLQVLDLATFTA